MTTYRKTISTVIVVVVTSSRESRSTQRIMGVELDQYPSKMSVF
jgi:hypothetical protein